MQFYQAGSRLNDQMFCFQSNYLKQQKMLQDNIRQQLSKIDQLIQHKEQQRYIIPLLFLLAKTIFQNAPHHYIQPIFLVKLRQRFRHVKNQQNIDQVHQFMLEQTQQMIESNQSQNSSIFKRTSEEDESEDQNIFLPQQSYYLYEDTVNHKLDIQHNQYLTTQSTTIRKSLFEQTSSVGSTVQECEAIWQRVQNFYKSHQLDQAYRQCVDYQNCLHSLNSNKIEGEQQNRRKQFISQLHHEYSQMMSNYQYFDEPDYIFDKKEKGVTMHYKVYEKTRQVAIRIEAEVDISIENFMCIVSEIDLFQEYIPFAYETKELKSISRNQKIGLSRVYIPLLSNREAYFYAAAFDRLKTHNSIFFYSKTITNDQHYQSKYNFSVPPSEFVDLQYKFYILEYTPISVGKGKVRLATNIDLKLKYLPMFIINKSARIFAFDYFKNIQKVNKHFSGSKWQERIKRRSELYNFFKARIQSHLKSPTE